MHICVIAQKLILRNSIKTICICDFKLNIQHRCMYIDFTADMFNCIFCYHFIKKFKIEVSPQSISNKFYINSNLYADI